MSTSKKDVASKPMGDTLNQTAFNNDSQKQDPESKSELGSNADDGEVNQSEGILSEDPFDNEKSRLLFDAIDQLRDCGAGKDLDLPQLVIVGRQSAGKSSLLKGLTDIPFKIGDGLCTRFATRIVSKRTLIGTAPLIQISIEDGDIDPFGEDPDQTRDFHRSLKSLTAEEFEKILEQASQSMGLSSEIGKGNKHFSSKVLKIEFSGPDRSHFGILDLPGIFLTPTRGVTQKEKDGVSSMVKAYMQKPQNIIICVADAPDDLANQEIFKLADEYADNERIVGVFTKCDKIDQPSKIVESVQKSEGTSERSLTHGWYVVRNCGPLEDQLSFDRGQVELALFSREPWTQIDHRRRGTAMLKKCLSSLLCQSIHKGFPKMQEYVQSRLEQEDARLAAMGPSRTDRESQTKYLTGIAQRFQALSGQALKSPEDLPSKDLKLRGMVERRKKEFARELRENGHVYEFVDIGTTIPVEPGTVESSRKTLYDEIRTQIMENQGDELEGMINPVVLKPLLKTQAGNWPTIAKDHLKKLSEITMISMQLILEMVCKEKGTSDIIQRKLQFIVQRFERDALESANTKLKTLWDEEALRLQTNNLTFQQNIKNAQKSRFEAALARYNRSRPASQFLPQLIEPSPIPSAWNKCPWTIIDEGSVPDLFAELHSHSSKNTEDEIHDLLKAYYEVAIEDFISFVNKHIAEPYLQDPQGPVLGMCTNFILNLPTDMIEELGGETEEARNERTRTEAAIERLRVAKQIAKETIRRMEGL